MIETIMGWLGFTSTSKYLAVLAELSAIKNELFWYKFINLSFQIVLIAIAFWMIWKFWSHIKPTKKEKKEGE